MSFVLFSSSEPRQPTLWYSEHLASISRGRFTVNNALIYFQLGQRLRCACWGTFVLVWLVELDRCSFFVVRFSCDESRITSPDPRAYKTHISSAALSAANPASSKDILDVFPHFFSVWYSGDSEVPPPDCLFALNPIPHWKSLSFAVCTRRSGVRYGSRTASLELRWIPNPAQGHFS